MNITTSLILHLLTESGEISNNHNTNRIPIVSRNLQTLPDYTSPPTEAALDATPSYYRSDDVINNARVAATANLCTTLDDPSACQILFPPSSDFDSSSSPSLGVIFYGGALVDPRSYSPLAKDLADGYGLAVSVPIFPNDVAFVGCTSDKWELAGRAFPTVEKWIMVGHSMGGIGVGSEVWTALSSTATTGDNGNDNGNDNGDDNGDNMSDMIGGMVLLGSYLRQDVGCGAIDFNNIDLPAAAISASLDGVVNMDRFAIGNELLSDEHTFKMNILGANHGGFGSYDYSGRKTILG